MQIMTNWLVDRITDGDPLGKEGESFIAVARTMIM